LKFLIAIFVAFGKLRKCLRKLLGTLRSISVKSTLETHSHRKGRYIVRLRLKISIDESLSIAVSSFRRLESTLNSRLMLPRTANFSQNTNTRSYDQKSTNRNCQTRANLLHSASRCLTRQQCNYPLTSLQRFKCRTLSLQRFMPPIYCPRIMV